MPHYILIAEDDNVLRQLLANKLKRTGYDVGEAVDGEEALRRLRERAVDLLLLDVLMPAKNGMEVLEEMRKDPTLKDVPVIIVSNSGQPFEIDRARSLGVKDFLIKATFDPKEVIEKVNAVLRVSPSTGTHASQEEETTRHSTARSQSKGAKTIILIEDEQMLHDLLRDKLTDAGFSVVGAMSGKSAMEALEKHSHPDLVILDLLLPDMNGFEILSAMRKDGRHASTSVMILSNLDQEKDIERAKTLGVSEFLIKAKYALPDIIERVKQML
jgi:DNA-binding response OmpR family regulator